MTQITKQYANPNNGGTERVYKIGDAYYVNSNWGSGWPAEKTEVTRAQVEMCMRATGAPDDVVSAILAD